MSDALAVCAAVVSADGQVLFGPRSQRIADSPSRPAQACYHVLPSGHPEPPQGLFEGLLMELQEEADINAEELTEAHLTGLIRALPSGKPELTFLLKTDPGMMKFILGVFLLGQVIWQWIHRENAHPPENSPVRAIGMGAFSGSVCGVIS